MGSVRVEVRVAGLGFLLLVKDRPRGQGLMSRGARGSPALRGSTSDCAWCLGPRIAAEGQGWPGGRLGRPPPLAGCSDKTQADGERKGWD